MVFFYYQGVSPWHRSDAVPFYAATGPGYPLLLRRKTTRTRPQRGIHCYPSRRVQQRMFCVSAMLGCKIFHEVCNGYHALRGQRIVHANTYAANRAVTFYTYKVVGFAGLQEFVL